MCLSEHDEAYEWDCGQWKVAIMKCDSNLKLCQIHASAFDVHKDRQSDWRRPWLGAVSSFAGVVLSLYALKMVSSSFMLSFEMMVSRLKIVLQSTLFISTSVISNNRLSQRENLVLVLTQKLKIRLQNIVEKRRNCSWGAISPLYHNIFNIYF